MLFETYPWKEAKCCLTLGGTRTPNPRFRRPMPYPLGHEGRCFTIQNFLILICSAVTFADSGNLSKTSLIVQTLYTTLQFAELHAFLNYTWKLKKKK